MNSKQLGRRTTRGLSPRAASKLAPLLERFFHEAAQEERVGSDPVQFPRRFEEPRDIEVAGLLAASLAYGRVDLFAPKIDALLEGMGASPARFVREATARSLKPLLEGFVYRFNLAADVGVLLLGMGQALREQGSLEAVFVQGLEHTGHVHGALGEFTAALRDVDLREVQAALGRTRGLGHLLPSPLGVGAAKRLNMYLRWMVRGPDAVDLGIWKRVPKSKLVIPLDTHIARISSRLGLTRRGDLGWKTAEEITESLRQIDPEDPVRFDFALCHHGMAGICSPRALAQSCSSCVLRASCRTGTRVMGPKRRKT